MIRLALLLALINITTAQDDADAAWLRAGSVPVAPAVIAWEASEIARDATLDEAELLVEFSGTCAIANRTLSVDHACGCMQTSVLPTSPGLGEPCRVAVKLDLAGVHGDIRKELKVRATAADGSSTTMRLIVAITMPSALSLEPTALYWNPSDEQSDRTALVTPLIEGVEISMSLDSPYWVGRYDPATRAVSLRPTTRPAAVPATDVTGCKYAMCRINAKLPSGRIKQYVLWGVQND